MRLLSHRVEGLAGTVYEYIKPWRRNDQLQRCRRKRKKVKSNSNTTITKCSIRRVGPSAMVSPVPVSVLGVQLLPGLYLPQRHHPRRPLLRVLHELDVAPAAWGRELTPGDMRQRWRTPYFFWSFFMSPLFEDGVAGRRRKKPYAYNTRLRRRVDNMLRLALVTENVIFDWLVET